MKQATGGSDGPEKMNNTFVPDPFCLLASSKLMLALTAPSKSDLVSFPFIEQAPM